MRVGIITRRDADHALVHELAGRLRRLERAIEETYAPALRRLAAQNDPGAGSAYAELIDGVGEGFEEALLWMRRKAAGVAFATGDQDLAEYYLLGLDEGEMLPGERTDDEVMAELVQDGGDVAERYARYLAGKAKAAAELEAEA